MKVKKECQNCHGELPLGPEWEAEIAKKENIKRDIELITHGICEGCLRAFYGEALGEEGIDEILNYTK